MVQRKNTRIVYSTDPESEDTKETEDNTPAPSPGNQHLKILLDRKKRRGKTVTLITGYQGTEEDRKKMAKKLKQLCGVGGSVKSEEILLQGDVIDQVIPYLKSKGYNIKRSGG